MAMTYQQERDHFIAQLTRESGLPAHQAVDLARQLLRHATTLHRLAEAQCNGDWPADNGERKVIPCPLCESSWVPSAITGGHLAQLAWKLAGGAKAPRPAWCLNPIETKACPDCRTAARVTELLADMVPAYKADFSGDPRGCVLKLYPADTPHEDIDSGRARPIYVPGRY